MQQTKTMEGFIVNWKENNTSSILLLQKIKTLVWHAFVFSLLYSDTPKWNLLQPDIPIFSEDF